MEVKRKRKKRIMVMKMMTYDDMMKCNRGRSLFSCRVNVVASGNITIKPLDASEVYDLFPVV